MSFVGTPEASSIRAPKPAKMSVTSAFGELGDLGLQQCCFQAKYSVYCTFLLVVGGKLLCCPYNPLVGLVGFIAAPVPDSDI